MAKRRAASRRLELPLRLTSLRSARSCSRWSFWVSGSAAGSTGIGSPSSTRQLSGSRLSDGRLGPCQQRQPDGRVAGQRRRDLLDRVVVVLRGQDLDDPTDAELLLGVQPAEVELAEVGQCAGIAAAQGPIGRLAFGKAVVAQLRYQGGPACAAGRPVAGRLRATASVPRCRPCRRVSSSAAAFPTRGADARGTAWAGQSATARCPGHETSPARSPNPNVSAIFSPGTWLNSTGRNEAPPRGVRRIKTRSPEPATSTVSCSSPVVRW